MKRSLVLLSIILTSLLLFGCTSTDPYIKSTDLESTDYFEPLSLTPSHELFQLRIPLHMITSTQKTQFENETWTSAGPARKITTQTTTYEIGYQNTTIYLGNGLSIDMTGNVFYDILKMGNVNLSESFKIEYAKNEFISYGEKIVNIIGGRTQDYLYVDKTLYSFTKSGKKLTRVIEGENSISENVFGAFDNKTFTYVTEVKNGKLQIKGLFLYGCTFEISENDTINGKMTLLMHPIRFNVQKDDNIIKIIITDGFLGSLFNKTEIVVVKEKGISQIYKDDKIIGSLSIVEQNNIVEIVYVKYPDSTKPKTEVFKIYK